MDLPERRLSTRWLVTGLAVLLLFPVVSIALANLLADDGDDPADATDLEGTWDVSLVVGLVDADPGADAFPVDVTYRETWVFEDCDEAGCTLRRPDGGFLFGDLDAMRVERGDGTGLEGSSEQRLVGDGEATNPPPVEADELGPCDTSIVQHWGIRVELEVRDQVLSGSAFRVPDALTDDVAGVACYGYDLTLGLSGTPAR